jgi:hypothetical protein
LFGVVSVGDIRRSSPTPVSYSRGHLYCRTRASPALLDLAGPPSPAMTLPRISPGEKSLIEPATNFLVFC